MGQGRAWKGEGLPDNRPKAGMSMDYAAGLFGDDHVMLSGSRLHEHEIAWFDRCLYGGETALLGAIYPPRWIGIAKRVAANTNRTFANRTQASPNQADTVETGTRISPVESEWCSDKTCRCRC
jgi:hypothetical protein